MQASASLSSCLPAFPAHNVLLSQAARCVSVPPAGGLCGHHHEHKARKAAAVSPSSSREGQGSRPWKMMIEVPLALAAGLQGIPALLKL